MHGENTFLLEIEMEPTEHETDYARKGIIDWPTFWNRLDTTV